MWLTKIPQETRNVLDERIESCNVGLRSLKEIAEVVAGITNGFGYGRSRAISSLISFPWPHEVEQIKEICCGTRALYRFLFAYYLKERFHIDYNAVFLLSPNHAKVGLWDREENYVLDGGVRGANDSDLEALQLDVDEVVELVNGIRMQNPLDLLQSDEVVIRTPNKGRTIDFTIKYDGRNVIFNIAVYAKPGTTTGLWLKMCAENHDVDFRGVKYVCPGSYHSWTPFQATECIRYHKDMQEILPVNEEVMRCIALDALYQHLLEEKRRENPGAFTVAPKESLKELQARERKKAGKSKKLDYFSFENGNYRHHHLEDVIELCSSRYEGVSSGEHHALSFDNRERLEDRLYSRGNLFNGLLYRSLFEEEEDRFDYEIVIKGERTLEKIDHEQFVCRLQGESTPAIVHRVQNVFGIPNFDQLMMRHFAQFQQASVCLQQESSLFPCISRVVEEYLKRYRGVACSENIAQEVMIMMFQR